MIDLFDDAFSVAELIEIISVSVPYLLLYFLTGFGPGFILGLLIINYFAGRGNPTFMDTHEQKIKEATQHNAQWNPEHDRWKK
jgi:hypothetical protein